MPSVAGQAAIGVLVVDDHAVVRRGLAAYLESADGIEAVAEAVNGRDALVQLRRLATENRLPKVVLMDVLMPEMDGISAIGEILASHPGVRVVMLTSFGEVERVYAALQAGAAGYLLKDADPELYISDRTARTHVSHVLTKLQLSSRTQAALVAIREGLIPPPSP